MPETTITIEPPRQDDVLELLRLSDEYALSLYPAESCYLLNMAELETDGVAVFVARDGSAGAAAGGHGTALGLAALVDRGDGSGEIKRVFVVDAARGRGIARALLAAIHARARAAGIRTLQLETGTRQVAATALYESTGYRVIPNFAPYVGDEFSMCVEKKLGLRV